MIVLVAGWAVVAFAWGLAGGVLGGALVVAAAALVGEVLAVDR